MTLYTIFSRRVANELERQGFRIIKMAKNNNLVYYFEDSVELRDALRPLIHK